MELLQEIIDIFIEKPLFSVGFYGPLLLIGMNVYFLYHRLFWLYIYIIFIVINTYINKILKIWIKQPRPDNWKSFISFEKLENEEKYGMPSGHAQSCMFSVMFYYLIYGMNEILYIMLFITSLTIYQRWFNKNHTLFQLLIGCIIGSIVAMFVVYISKKYKNKISLWNI
jgi:membrane-associated phospholipid phosphatase